MKKWKRNQKNRIKQSRQTKDYSWRSNQRWQQAKQDVLAEKFKEAEEYVKKNKGENNAIRSSDTDKS